MKRRRAKVSIAHRGLDVHVAKQLLDFEDARARKDQVRGEGCDAIVWRLIHRALRTRRGYRQALSIAL
jgi:hypothetical protein